MERRNRYYARSRISERKFRQLLRYFAMDFSATDVAELTGIRGKAVTMIFLKIRERIAEEAERASPFPAKSKLMNLTSVLEEFEASEAEEPVARLRSSVC